MVTGSIHLRVFGIQFRRIDNFKSFFNHGDPDWERIREKIQALPVEHK